MGSSSAQLPLPRFSYGKQTSEGPEVCPECLSSWAALTINTQAEVTLLKGKGAKLKVGEGLPSIEM